MKTKGLKLITLIAILTSVFAYSQDWQPKKIQFEGETGLFLPFSIMDSVSVKLIERKSLKTQNLSLGALLQNLQDQNTLLQQQNNELRESSADWKAQYLATEAQRDEARSRYDNQVIITKNNKKKARANGLKLFGGGVVIGAALFLLFGG